MDNEALITMGQITFILGVILPPILAVIKRANWPERTKDMVILVALILVGGGAAFVTGDISPTACAEIGLEECVTIIIGYISLVIGQAFIWYKFFWQASGIDDKIAGK